MSLFLIVIAFLALLFFGTDVTSTSTDPTECSISTNGEESCGTASQIGVAIEADTVIYARVNNGPVAPNDQVGYEFVVNADGTVNYSLQRAENSEGMISAEEGQWQMAPAEIEGIFTKLDACGYFALPQASEFDPADLPDGGGISILDVTRDGVSYSVNAAFLQGVDAQRFKTCQTQLVQDFGINMDPEFE